MLKMSFHNSLYGLKLFHGCHIRYNASVGKYNVQFTVQNICRKKHVITFGQIQSYPFTEESQVCHFM